LILIIFIFRLKCTVIVRIINWLTITSFDGYWNNQKTPRVTEDSNVIFTQNLFRLVTLCILKPSAVGFNLTDKTVLVKLPEEVSFVISVRVIRKTIRL